MTAITSDDHLHREAVIHAAAIRAAFLAARGLSSPKSETHRPAPSCAHAAPGVRAVQVAGLDANQFPPSSAQMPASGLRAIDGFRPAGFFLTDAEESEGGEE
jgi:hypothetical protein